MEKPVRTSISKREALFLLVLMVLLFTLFNTLNFSRSRWTLHPDDHDVLVFSKVLLKTGHLWYETPFNEKYRTEAFQPDVERFTSAGGERYAVHAAYSPGVYVVLAPGQLAGWRGPFYVVSILGLVGIFFLYLFTREVFGTAEAMVASLFLGLSAAYIYWSNMLFSNIPALAFFAAGLFFLAKTVSEPGARRYYFSTVVFFVLSVWVRYDYILLVALVALVSALVFRRKLKGRLVLESTGLLATMVALIAAVNYSATRSITGIPGKFGAGQQSSGDLVRYLPRLFSPAVLLTNARMYVYWVAPVLVVMGVLGIVLALKARRGGFVYMLLGVSALVLFVYGKSSGFWGYNKNWLASSYTRYFLPLFMCLAVFAGVFTVWCLRRIPWRKVALIATVAILSAHVITSVFVLYGNQFGIKFTGLYNHDRRSVDEFVSTLPEKAVVVDLSSDNYFRFDIVSRVVLNPSYFPKKQAPARLAKIVRELEAGDVPVYIINNPERSMLDVPRFASENRDIVLKVLKHTAIFNYGSRTPDIYEVEVAR